MIAIRRRKRKAGSRVRQMRSKKVVGASYYFVTVTVRFELAVLNVYVPDLLTVYWK